MDQINYITNYLNFIQITTKQFFNNKLMGANHITDYSNLLQIKKKKISTELSFLFANHTYSERVIVSYINLHNTNFKKIFFSIFFLVQTTPI